MIHSITICYYNYQSHDKICQDRHEQKQSPEEKQYEQKNHQQEKDEEMQKVGEQYYTNIYINITM